MSSGYPMKVVELLAGEDQQFDRIWGGAFCDASPTYTASQLINSSPCVLYGYIVHVATATGLITIKDGTSSSGGVTKITIPMGKEVGEYALPLGINCASGIYLAFGTSVTGSISVLYLPAV